MMRNDKRNVKKCKNTNFDISWSKRVHGESEASLMYVHKKTKNANADKLLAKSLLKSFYSQLILFC